MTRLFIIFGILLSGCTVPNGKLLSELNDKQADSVCDEFGARTILCGDEETGETYLFDCASVDAPSGCPATVGDYRACLEAVEALSDASFCETQGGPEACYPLLDADCLPE